MLGAGDAHSGSTPAGSSKKQGVGRAAHRAGSASSCQWWHRRSRLLRHPTPASHSCHKPLYGANASRWKCQHHVHTELAKFLREFGHHCLARQQACTRALPIRSDSDGKVAATLTVTGKWATGRHTITAQDAAGYPARVGEQIIVVVPGQAQTPGPNGGTVCGDIDDGHPVPRRGRSAGCHTLKLPHIPAAIHTKAVE